MLFVVAMMPHSKPSKGRACTIYSLGILNDLHFGVLDIDIGNGRNCGRVFIVLDPPPS